MTTEPLSASPTLADDARTARQCLDLTSLGDTDSAASTQALCARAVARQPWTAAVCVWPQWVATARAALPESVRVAAVANFPNGGTDLSAALADVQRIVEAGGQEVDLVLPWRAMLAGDVRSAAGLVAAVRQATPGLLLKLIIESGELHEAAAIREACRIGLGEGVDMLKTSTGKTPHGAHPDAARVMLDCISQDPRGAQSVGFKASGGVRTVADAAMYAQLVTETLGPLAVASGRFRIGASGLLDQIDACLGALSHAPPQPDAGY